MNQASFDRLQQALHLTLHQNPDNVLQKDLYDLWNSYLRESERCRRLEEELYELREEIKRLKHET